MLYKKQVSIRAVEHKSTQVIDSEAKKIVSTSIRLDAELHGRLADIVHAKKRSGVRASIDGEIQEAVKRALSEKLVPNSEQTIVCDGCKSTLCLLPDGSTKVLVRNSVPNSEQADENDRNQAIIDARSLLLEAVLTLETLVGYGAGGAETEKQAADFERRVGDVYADVASVSAHLRGVKTNRKGAQRPAKKHPAKA